MIANQKIHPTDIFVNQKSIDSYLFQKIKKAHPTAKIIPISTNTKISDPTYGLISLDPKKRGLQKRKYLGVWHRNSKWNLDPNGRSTDFLPSNMLVSQSGISFIFSITSFKDISGKYFRKLR